MKKLFITLAALAITFSAFAQGTVNFATRSLGAKVLLPDGVAGPGLGAKSITAQLAIVGAGGALTLLAPTATFGTTATTQWYVSGGLVPVTGALPGTTATLRMLAYETSFGSYDLAKAAEGALWGFSNDVTTGALGGTPAVGLPVTPPNLTGLQGFTLTLNPTIVPEPTTLALLGLGGLALAIRRRK